MFEAYKPHDYTVNFFKPTRHSEPNSKIRTKRLRPVSPKRALANKLYEAAKRKWRKIRIALDGFRCEVVRDGHRCNRRAARNPHHIQGRVGRLLYEISNFLAACQRCHDYIHANPQWAYENGYLKLRK